MRISTRAPTSTRSASSSTSSLTGDFPSSRGNCGRRATKSCGEDSARRRACEAERQAEDPGGWCDGRPRRAAPQRPPALHAGSWRAISDAITMKALEKEPDRRYGTPSELVARHRAPSSAGAGSGPGAEPGLPDQEVRPETPHRSGGRLGPCAVAGWLRRHHDRPDEAHCRRPTCEAEVQRSRARTDACRTSGSSPRHSSSTSTTPSRTSPGPRLRGSWW